TGTSPQVAIQKESQHSGNQQQHANGSASGELQLTDHGFIGFHGQHVVGATHDLGYTEVGDGQRKDQASGRKNGITAGGQRHCQETTQGVRAHGSGRVIQTGIGQSQTCAQNHQGMGESVESFAQHNAPETINRFTAQPVAQQALIAEQVNQGQAWHQGGCQQGQQTQGTEQTCATYAAALQGKGKGIGSGDDDKQGGHANQHAAAHHGHEA